MIELDGLVPFGDVIQTVNGEPINSDDQIMKVFTKFQGATSFRLGIVRDVEQPGRSPGSYIESTRQAG